MKILITGVRGITGSFLVEKLSSTHTVYGMDHEAGTMEGVQRVFGCSEFPELPEMDVVIHVAGKVEETLDLAKSLEYMENNVGLTQCIFNWFKKSTAKQFYYLSSIKVIGNRSDGLELTEAMQPNPFGPLGESKYLAEQFLQSNWLMDKKVYILRVSLLHGNGLLLNENSQRIYKWVKSGYPYVFGSFECRRSFTSLDNLHAVVALMLTKNIQAGVYHVADDGWLTSKDFFRMTGHVLGKKVRIWHLGKGLFKMIALLMDLFDGYFNSYEYKKLSINFVASNRKLKDALGLESMPFPMKEGVEKSIKEYAESLTSSNHE